MASAGEVVAEVEVIAEEGADVGDAVDEEGVVDEAVAAGAGVVFLVDMEVPQITILAIVVIATASHGPLSPRLSPATLNPKMAPMALMRKIQLCQY